ncbi:MAG: hypothetical protein WCG80_12755 [Spirochaetales bacterium]
MKYFVGGLLLVGVLLLAACGSQGLGGLPTGGGGILVPLFGDMAKFGNAVYGRDGITKSLARASDASPLTVYVGASKGKAAGSQLEPEKILFQEKRGAAGTTHKAVVFNDKAVQPSPYPFAFTKDGENYLLYSVSKDFELYRQNSENDDSIVYKKSTLWDFSAISTYVKSILYNGQNNAWIFCPVWSEARQTLYFTLAKWEVNATKGDFIRIRVYESKLIGTQFQTPTESQGEIDPYDPSHYVDGLRHSENDFPGRMGIGWIGRLYVTADGTRAYFNALNDSFGEDYGILKPGDPLIFPTPNVQNLGTSGVTDVYDPSLIQTVVYQADIDASGRFVNVQQLPASINQGGVNFVSDIAPDGKTLMVSHMEVDDDFYAFGWGADGLALYVCMNGAEATEPWRGYLVEYQQSGLDWLEVNSIGKTVATTHSAPWIAAKAQFDAWGSASEASFRADRPWLASTSTVTPTFKHGQFSYNIVDHPDMTFVNDAALVGTWNVVDFVKDQVDFVPGSKSFTGSLYFGPQVTFYPYATPTSSASWTSPLGGVTWTNGIVWGADMGAMEYTHLDTGGKNYLFVQWKSGDYSIMGNKPYYYVFQKE